MHPWVQASIFTGCGQPPLTLTIVLILLGNGTGLAGLRGLLKARIEGIRDNWLFFGERSAAHDFYCREELQGWLANGDRRG